MNRFLLIVTLFMLLLPVAQAQILNEDIDYYVTKVNIIVTHEFDLTEYSQNEFSMNLPKDARTIEVYGDDQKQEYSLENNILTIDTSLINTLTISYITNEYIESEKKEFFLLTFNSEAIDYHIKLTLPEGALLITPLDSPKPSIIPRPSTTSTTGRQILIEWDSTSLESNDTILVIYEFEKESSLILYIGIIIVLLLAYLIFRRKSKSKSPKKEDVQDDTKIEVSLYEEEKAIVNALNKAENKELWQKELEIKTKLSKVKLSRRLRSLEQRGMIEKTPYGNTNKIKLKHRNSTNL